MDEEALRKGFVLGVVVIEPFIFRVPTVCAFATYFIRAPSV